MPSRAGRPNSRRRVRRAGAAARCQSKPSSMANSIDETAIGSSVLGHRPFVICVPSSAPSVTARPSSTLEAIVNCRADFKRAGTSLREASLLMPAIRVRGDRKIIFRNNRCSLTDFRMDLSSLLHIICSPLQERTDPMSSFFDFARAIVKSGAYLRSLKGDGACFGSLAQSRMA